MTNYTDPDGFAEWEATVPESFKRDPIWRTPAYRYSLWLSDLAKQDARILRANVDTRTDVDQLLRAVGCRFERGFEHADTLHAVPEIGCKRGRIRHRVHKIHHAMGKRMLIANDMSGRPPIFDVRMTGFCGENRPKTLRIFRVFS